MESLSQVIRYKAESLYVCNSYPKYWHHRQLYIIKAIKGIMEKLSQVTKYKAESLYVCNSYVNPDIIG